MQSKINAEKIYKGSFIERLFGDTSRYSLAAEEYEKAGKIFKIEKNLQSSFEAFKEAHRIFLMVGDKYRASVNIIEAAKVYKDINYEEFLKLFRSGIQILLDEGNITVATRNEIKLAEICKELFHYEDAIFWYEKALNHSEQKYEKRKLLEELARLYVQKDKFVEAASLFEELAGDSQYNIEDYLFTAGICRLSVDLVDAKKTEENYSFIGKWSNSTERRILLDIFNTVETSDAEEFQDLVLELDSRKTLDQIKVKILNIIKKTIVEEENLC